MSAKIGGQAVIEGVMLKSDCGMSVAVRRKDGDIAVKLKELTPLAKRAFILRIPFVRGFFQLLSLLVLGFEALKFSVDVVEEKESEANSWLFVGSAVFAVLFTILFFFVLPLVVTQFARRYAPFLGDPVWFNTFEGVIRLLFFVLYLLCISLLDDIKRVFEYHGAEHKVIAAFEDGAELTPENAAKYSRFHPRCGTSFLILVVLVSVVFFTIFRPEALWGKVLLRVVAFPVLAGFIFELLKLEKYRFFRALFLPGILLQHITTREPNRDQLEVAIKAFTSLKT